MEEYGIWSLTYAMIGFVGLIEAGVATSTTVYVSRDLANNDLAGVSQTLTVTITAMLALATIALVVLWVGAAPLVKLFPSLDKTQQEMAISSFQVGGFVIWTRLLQQVLIGAAQAGSRYGTLTIINTIQAIINYLGLIILAMLGGRSLEFMKFLAALGVGTLVAHVVVVWSIAKNLNLKRHWSNAKGLVIMQYSMKTWLSSLCTVLFSQVDRLIVGSFLGMQVLGVYASITNIASQINNLSSMAVQPLLPRLSKISVFEGSSLYSIQQQVKQAVEVNVLVALGMGAALTVLAPILLSYMIPSAESGLYIFPFKLAILIYSLYSINAVGSYILFSLEELYAIIVIQSVSAISALICILFGAVYAGLTGAIVGNCGYMGVWFLIIVSMRRLRIPANKWSKWVRFPLILFILIAGISLIFCNYQLHVSVLISIVVVQTIILFYWFIVAQAKNTFPFIRSLIKNENN